MTDSVHGGTDRREEQQELVQEAERLPGVSDIFEVYRSLRPFHDLPQPAPPEQIVYATGGNAR
jgi:hypothetical protein